MRTTPRKALVAVAAATLLGAPAIAIPFTLDADAASSTTYRNLTSEQKANAATIVDVAERHHLGRRAMEIAIATAMQESTLRNLDHGDRDSLGLFQQRPSTGWGTPAQIRTPKLAAEAFFGVAEHTHNPGLVDVKGWQSMPLTRAAQAVQRSGFPDAYARWESLAKEVVDHELATSSPRSTTQRPTVTSRPTVTTKATVRPTGSASPRPSASATASSGTVRPTPKPVTPPASPKATPASPKATPASPKATPASPKATPHTEPPVRTERPTVPVATPAPDAENQTQPPAPESETQPPVTETGTQSAERPEAGTEAAPTGDQTTGDQTTGDQTTGDQMGTGGDGAEAPAADAEGAPSQDTSGGLADTGAPVSPFLVVSSVAAVVGGTVLLVRRRPS